MNVILQSLSVVDPFASFMVTGGYQSTRQRAIAAAITTEDDNGEDERATAMGRHSSKKPELGTQLSHLLRSMWSGHFSQSQLIDFKHVLGECNPVSH